MTKLGRGYELEVEKTCVTGDPPVEKACMRVSAQCIREADGFRRAAVSRYRAAKPRSTAAEPQSVAADLHFPGMAYADAGQCGTLGQSLRHNTLTPAACSGTFHPEPRDTT